VEGLRVIDPTRAVDFYRGRWSSAESKSGRYVGRRPQAYGADIWCYVEVENGQPARLVDLPVSGPLRGCDEAWLIQAAIDYVAGCPQRFTIRMVDSGVVAVAFYSPLPSWAQRRWETVGGPFEMSGCLFSYRIDKEDLEEELDFLADRLWMAGSRT
jgi:hypothetical protein